MIKKIFSFWLHTILYYILLIIIAILISQVSPNFAGVIAVIGFFYCPYRAFKKVRHNDKPKGEQFAFPTSDFIEKTSTTNVTQTSHTSPSNQKMDVLSSHSPVKTTIPSRPVSQSRNVPTPKVTNPPPTSSSRPIQATSSSKANLLDLNQATVQQINDIPGINLILGKKIIQNREQKGPYTSMDDLVARVHPSPQAERELRAYATIQPSTQGRMLDY